MKSTLHLWALPAICFLSGLFSLHGRAADDDSTARPIFDKLLSAMDTKDYEAFVVDGTDEVKGAITKTQFDAVAGMMDAKGAREVTFLGELDQRGFMVYLYRLRYKDGDVLGTLSLKDGKVAGIFFK